MTKVLTYNLITLLICIFLYPVQATAGKPYRVESPDKQLSISVELGTQISYQVSYQGRTLLLPSTVSLRLDNGVSLGIRPKLLKASTQFVNRQVKPLYGMNAVIADTYAELRLTFSGQYAIEFRAYNQGIAYRFVTSFRDSIQVKNEEATFRLAGDYLTYFHPSAFLSSYEEPYLHRRISQFDSAGQLTSLPIVAEVPQGPRLAILESDLLDYPGMYLRVEPGQKTSLQGVFAPIPTKVHVGGHQNFNLIVDERDSLIARTAGTRSFPWRAIAVAAQDKDLLNNELVYLLASENKLNDTSWIKPGKVAWDWWVNLNLTGVPFKTGFNTATYKYFIDFAATNKIEYINLDEGWSDQFDLLKTNPALDLPEVIRYAHQKNVGIILWCVWHTLDRQMQPALDQFAKWGIAGLKVDFMDRDDQLVVNFYERLLREAAKRRMLVNYHGAYKPTGLERTYPNQINRESVRGMEWDKFHRLGSSPEHTVSIPFIRMVAGSVDYTPGAMTNANQTDWRQINDRPMSQGTRCHQLAMYTVFYAPLQMLSDSPTAYEREPDVLRFLAGAPTVWDKTVPLAGKIGDYVAVARKKGNVWYVGAMNDWTARSLTLSLDFLDEGAYTAELFADGSNADRIGNDYTRTIRTVKKGETITIQLAPGGGWTACLMPGKSTD